MFSVGSFLLNPTEVYAEKVLPNGQCPPGTSPNPNPTNANNACVQPSADPLTPGSVQAINAGNSGAINSDNEGCDWFDVGCQIMSVVIPFVVEIILKFVALLTGVAAILLNGVVYFTVVKVSENYAALDPIKEAWKVLRDISNMAFIFVLLYAAIKTILGQGGETQRLIKNIIVVAVLINFSMFFTRIVIDMGNVLALVFYDAIAPGSLSDAGTVGINEILSQAGLATAFMNALNLQSLYNVGSSSLTIPGIITVGIMGSVMLLIAAFSFFAVALMFIIRYVILILVLILSPIAFIAHALPKGQAGSVVSKYANQWQGALIGQTFFAPIYFMLTWIAIRVLSGVMKAFGGTGSVSAEAFNQIAMGNGGAVVQGGAFLMFMNFAIVITLIIASLIVAKQFADSAGGGVGKLTSWATGVAGGATVGLAGRFGRSNVGAGASRLAQNENFQRWAGRSVVGQQLLKATNKTAKSSFDLRATRVGDATLGQVGAGQAEKGGYEAALQKRIEKKDKFAQTLRSNASKEAYAQRIAGGVLTRAGSRSSANTVFGVLGRQNRIVAAKIINDRITKLQTDLNTANTELTRYQNILASGGRLTTIQAGRHATLTAGVGTSGSVAYIQNNITNLQNQADRLGLNNLTAAEQTANITARTAGNPAPHRGTRADEQRY